MSYDWDPISEEEYIQERRLERVRRYMTNRRTDVATKLLIKEWSTRGAMAPMREFLQGVLGGEETKRGRKPYDAGMLVDWQMKAAAEFRTLGSEMPKATRFEKLSVLADRYSIGVSTMDRHVTNGGKWLHQDSPAPEDFSPPEELPDNGFDLFLSRIQSSEN